LQWDLIPVEDDGRDGGRAFVRPGQSFGLLRDPWCLAFQVQALDVLPPRLAAGADMGAGIAAWLEHAVVRSGAVDAGPALDQFLLDLGPLGGEEELVLALCPHHRLAHEDSRTGEGRVRAQAHIDLLGEGDLERVPLDLGPVGALDRVDRGESTRVLPGSRPREGTSP